MNSGSKFKININVSKLVTSILIIIIILIVGKYALDFYCSHDTHETVSASGMFKDKTKYIDVSSLKFHVSSNLNVGIGDTYFTAEDDNNEYVIRVEVQETEYEYLLNNIDSLKGNTEGTYNGPAQIHNYNGREYITIETADWLSKTLVAFTKVNDDKILFILIINKKNTYDYGLLKEFTEIINEVE